jgi:hypothetical protein
MSCKPSNSEKTESLPQNRRPARRQVPREHWQRGSRPSKPGPSHGRELAILNLAIGSLQSSYSALAQFQMNSMVAVAWSREAAKLTKPAGEDVLQKLPVSKRVNSSRARDDDPDASGKSK